MLVLKGYNSDLISEPLHREALNVQELVFFQGAARRAEAGPECTWVSQPWRCSDVSEVNFVSTVEKASQ